MWGVRNCKLAQHIRPVLKCAALDKDSYVQKAHSFLSELRSPSWKKAGKASHLSFPAGKLVGLCLVLRIGYVHPIFHACIYACVCVRVCACVHACVSACMNVHLCVRARRKCGENTRAMHVWGNALAVHKHTGMKRCFFWKLTKWHREPGEGDELELWIHPPSPSLRASSDKFLIQSMTRHVWLSYTYLVSANKVRAGISSAVNAGMFYNLRLIYFQKFDPRYRDSK